MKKQLTTLLASTLLAGSLMLPACGGQPSTSDSSSGEKTTESVEEVKVDPAEKFIGTWKFAGAQMQGVTMVGDLTELIGEEASISFTLDEGGTGTAGVSDDSKKLTWELDGDDAIKLTVEADEEADDSEPKTVTGTLKDDVLSVDMSDEDQQGTFMLTKSGKMENAKEILPANATAITSENELVGTWKLVGMNMMGISVYGSADDLAQFAGDTFAGDLVLNAGGTGTFADSEVTWEVTDNGATLGQSGLVFNLKALDDGIIMDFGELGEAMGMDIVLYFTK